VVVLAAVGDLRFPPLPMRGRSIEDRSRIGHFLYVGALAGGGCLRAVC
jgi:hypothetical protein